MTGNNTRQGYDVIGDIHGHAKELKALLKKLGYEHDGLCYRHPCRQALFLGDFVDRGPYQREVIETVMAMCEGGAAHAIMGNHEFNALAFHTEYPGGSGQWLRPRTNKNIRQHLAFLRAYLGDDKELNRVLAWFRTLPLWLELDEGLRLVHACWYEPAMRRLQDKLGCNNTLTSDLLIEASQIGSQAYDDVEALLKGREVKLPEGIHFTDKDGFERDQIRIRWWRNNAQSYADLAQPPYVVERNPRLNDLPLVQINDLGYPEDAPPVFFGHYWFEGTPQPEQSNVFCLDYSVPRETGKLAAYRWTSDQNPGEESFVWVNNGAGSA